MVKTMNKPDEIKIDTTVDDLLALYCLDEIEEEREEGIALGFYDESAEEEE